MWQREVLILMMCSLSFRYAIFLQLINVANNYARTSLIYNIFQISSVSLQRMLKLTYTGQVGQGEQGILALRSCFLNPDISSVWPESSGSLGWSLNTYLRHSPATWHNLLAMKQQKPLQVCLTGNIFWLIQCLVLSRFFVGLDRAINCVDGCNAVLFLFSGNKQRSC